MDKKFKDDLAALEDEMQKAGEDEGGPPEPSPPPPNPVRGRWRDNDENDKKSKRKEKTERGNIKDENSQT